MTTTDNNKLHEDINLILPWYLNGTLQPDELAKVESHISLCSDCKTELERLKLVQSSVIQSDEALSIPLKEMEEDIMGRIDSYEIRNENVKGFSIWAKVSDFIESFQIPNFSPSLAMTLVVVQLVVIGVLAGKLYTQDPKTFITLSGDSTIKDDSPMFIVDFKNTASEEEIRKLLVDFNAKIIDGPKADRYYIVQVQKTQEAKKTDEEILEELKDKKDIIEFVGIHFQKTQKK